MSNELTVIESQGMNIPALRDPQEIMAEAQIRATALVEMVKRTGSSTRIGNKEHLHFEAWATIGAYYGCTASAEDVQPVDLGGIHGFRAVGRVHDATGRVVAQAISYCMRDEENWEDKETFQLASMAQTRAMSKALASKFRWVVVMAGYAPTPAEEMGKITAKGASSGSDPAVNVSAPPVAHDAPGFTIPGGYSKGKRFDDPSVSLKDLAYWAQNGKREELRNAAQAEINRRKGKPSIMATDAEFDRAMSLEVDQRNASEGELL